MRDVLNATQAAAVLRCAPMKVKKRIEIGEWPGRIIPKNKTRLAYDTRPRGWDRNQKRRRRAINMQKKGN